MGGYRITDAVSELRYLRNGSPYSCGLSKDTELSAEVGEQAERLGRLATVVNEARRDIEAIARQARTIETRLDDCVGALRHELSTIAPMVTDVVAAALRAGLDNEPRLSDPRLDAVDVSL